MVDSNLSSKVELFVSCKNIPKLDVLSKSDPFVVVSFYDEATSRFEHLGRTETIKDNHNPEFAKQFQMEYFFEENQSIQIDLYDEDTSSGKLKDQDYVGFVRTSLAEIVTAPGQKFTKQLTKKNGTRVVGADRKPSLVSIRCEEISADRDDIVFILGCKGLPKMDLFGRADPYLEIFRSREDMSWIPVHKTEVIKSTYSPSWKPFRVTVQSICNGDYDRPLWLKVWDWDRMSSPELIGEKKTCLRDLSAGTEHPLERYGSKSRRKKKYGHLVVKKCAIIKNYTFLDFIQGGCEVSLMVAIDFTASNGAPSDPHSLHYQGSTNQYIKAIQSIGNVLVPYDSDQKFPVWGFGARIGDSVSHCFSLTFDEYNPEVVGVEGILHAYRNAFSRLRLSGPTLFSQIINTADAIASTPFTAETQNYYILLILTDGVINDVQKTIDSIVNASEKPLSIIIVGVGGANFDTMDVLDADDAVLKSSRGKRAQRDIVQFVPFRDFQNVPISRLAKETLAEVPGQFLQFMKRHNIKPLAGRPIKYPNVPGYDEQKVPAYPPAPGVAPQGSFAQMPGVLPQGIYAQMPGVLPQGSFAQMPGVLPQGSYAQMPGVLPQGSYAQMPGVLPQGSYAQMPGMPVAQPVPGYAPQQPAFGQYPLQQPQYPMQGLPQQMSQLNMGQQPPAQPQHGQGSAPTAPGYQ